MLYHCTCFDDGVAHDYGVLYLSALFYLDTCEKNGMLYRTIHAATVCDHRIFHYRIGTDHMTGLAAVSAVDLPVIVEQVNAAVLRIHDFHVGFPERRNGTNILPVAVKMVGIHLSAVL